ncbi:hypothetical protein ACIBUR_39850 [Streptomyces anulatus]
MATTYDEYSSSGRTITREELGIIVQVQPPTEPRDGQWLDLLTTSDTTETNGAQ